MKHKGTAKFVATNNPSIDKFYTKEFESNSGTIFYIHYFASSAETTIHESFVYNNLEDRDNDFKIIQEKLAVVA